MLRKRRNILVPVSIAGLCGAQLLKYVSGCTGTAVALLIFGLSCMLLEALQNRPGRGKFKASKKRLIYGGLDVRKRRTSN